MNSVVLTCTLAESPRSIPTASVSSSGLEEVEAKALFELGEHMKAHIDMHARNWS